MQETLQKYLHAFKKLRIDRAHGIAPHKPILLLSVLQTFQNGINTNRRVYITPELVALFKSNWSLLVTSNHDCRFALPFYHLTSDLFWKLIPKAGFENILQLKASMRSFANLNAAICENESLFSTVSALLPKTSKYRNLNSNLTILF